MNGTAAEPAPALKDALDNHRVRQIADVTLRVSPAFDAAAFLAACGDLTPLSLMARITRIAEGFQAALPGGFRENVEVLSAVTPSLGGGFATLIPPEYVALYGADDFEPSMQALKVFTRFGTSEFAVRHFLRRDLPRTLAVMQTWAQDADEHVRRLASEGSRPRLPWSFHLKPLMVDPSPLAPILEALKDDPSLYVRRSVANSLNDITKDNPGWVLDRLEAWPLDRSGPAWIAKHALRSLIKKGDPRALALIGAGQAPQVVLSGLQVSPPRIRLGEAIELAFALSSTTEEAQRLVVDYAIHYVKKSGGAAPKVFKLKALDLAGGSAHAIRKRQLIANFTTRVHYPGEHVVEIFANGQSLGRTVFTLVFDPA